jgi:hypothetical protein
MISFSARNAVTTRLVKASLRYQIPQSSDNNDDEAISRRIHPNGRTRLSDVDAVSFSLYLSFGINRIAKIPQVYTPILIRCLLPMDIRPEAQLAGSQRESQTGECLVSRFGGCDHFIRISLESDPLEGSARAAHTVESKGTVCDDNGWFCRDIDRRSRG